MSVSLGKRVSYGLCFEPVLSDKRAPNNAQRNQRCENHQHGRERIAHRLSLSKRVYPPVETSLISLKCRMCAAVPRSAKKKPRARRGRTGDPRVILPCRRLVCLS